MRIFMCVGRTAPVNNAGNKKLINREHRKIKLKRLNFNFHEHVGTFFMFSSSKIQLDNCLWIKFHCENFLSTVNEWINARCVFVCHVTADAFSVVFFFLLLRSQPSMPLCNEVKSETKAEKAKPEIINKLNPIFMTLPAFELRRVRNSQCDAILLFIAFVPNFFFCSSLNAENIKRRRSQKRIFIIKEKKKAFHVPRIFLH